MIPARTRKQPTAAAATAATAAGAGGTLPRGLCALGNSSLKSVVLVSAFAAVQPAACVVLRDGTPKTCTPQYSL